MIIVQDGIEGKICRKCIKWKPMADYYNNKSSKDGKQHFCKVCQRAIQRDNPDARCAKCQRRRGDFKDHGGHLDEEFGKHWTQCKRCHSKYNTVYPKTDRGKERVVIATEKRRAREQGLDGIDRGHCHPYEWRLLLLVHGEHCLIPGCTEIILENDHIIPHSKGGSNEIWNRQQMCKTHNSSKHNFNNIDYRPDQGILAMAIHNLRIGQCTDRKQKKRYYEWVVAQIEEKGPQVLLTLPHIFDWLEPLELQLAA